MKTVCEKNKCVACHSCVNICSKKAITIQDNFISTNAVIDTDKCVNCGMCEKVCQVKVAPSFHSPRIVKQGWINDTELRKTSSSGGFATAIIKHFLGNNDIVFACSYSYGDFIIKEVSSLSELIQIQGSKYVKSITGDSYKKVRKALTKTQKKVLFLGLPCQIQGLLLYLRNCDTTNLYTVDLICHGTPSSMLFRKYLEEEGYDNLEDLDVSFRKKHSFKLNVEKKSFEYWSYPFLEGLSYTDNCYSCQFARFERVSDFTIGDSWGSMLKNVDPKEGISLILCNTEKACVVLQHLDMTLFDVDIENAIVHNNQLRKPSEKPKKRDLYERCLRKSGNYHYSIKRVYPYLVTRTTLSHSMFGKLIKRIIKK